MVAIVVFPMTFFARASPFVPTKDSVRGFVFDVANGTLAEVAS